MEKHILIIFACFSVFKVHGGKFLLVEIPDEDLIKIANHARLTSMDIASETLNDLNTGT